ncbi:MAG: 2-C-methyl-D-erythritol 2,4-cyclodiphosphate synthase [Nitrospira sp.]|nr:2-C-methyl-D-erythritol 2,4-cyclodiphosphate synthase [Candidatus Manganitrophaceae bacterium]HIL33839.1 2-C-methyl-D-erythritol 2,4-cyclodiphosphate synthase [Candidatus Manganitrophaceae bacterium]
MTRIGIGYDVHPFEEGRRCILGGIDVPCSKGLKGHSDADVLLHAVCDALLGASGQGDIGVHFPDNDPRWKGISSLKFLEEVGHLLSEKGWSVVNVDAVIIAEHPKISPYAQGMKKNISRCLLIGEDQVNIKATTNEGMGFIGRGEGIAVQAVALIEESKGMIKGNIPCLGR